MTLFGQQLINGLSISSIYALIAIGYSLIYSILRFSNFAHLGFLLFGAYVGFFMVTMVRLPLPLCLLGAIYWPRSFSLNLKR